MKTKRIFPLIVSAIALLNLFSCTPSWEVDPPYESTIYVINKSSYDITMRYDWCGDVVRAYMSIPVIKTDTAKILYKELRYAKNPSELLNYIEGVERYCVIINDSVVKLWYDNDKFEEGQHHFYNDDSWELDETHDEYEHTLRSWYFTITDDDLDLTLIE